MTHKRSTVAKFSIATFFALIILSITSLSAQSGEAIFKANCTSCHAMDKTLTGPALQGVGDRWNGDKTKLHAWISNSGSYLKTGDKYANELFNQYKVQMTAFGGALSDKDIDAVIEYITTWKPPVPTIIVDGGPPTETGDSTLLFGILTLILAVIAFILLQVNANLKKLSDDKEGVPAFEPVPFWRNKTYIAFATVILFLIGGYLTVDGAIGLGRTQNYEPKQPIFYSHAVHAGVNQINCQYCHVGVYQGKQATIPSVNICMNCHMAISSYSSKSPLYDADGNKVDGTAEIQKLYQYAGWDASSKKYVTESKPIEWVRIHNLPDHVYFNHSQHVTVGKVQCQTCHGEITKMNEVYQFAPLSMGWCVNCHRSTKVQFDDNGFYSIYEKYHDAIKNKTMDSVTVENIGGTECQKCHY